MNIRKATTDDFESIYALIKEFSIFIKTPEKVSITVEQMVRDKEYFHCLVATQDDVIIGFASYFFAYYSWSGKTLYLDDLYVQDAYRGQLTGTKLMDAIFDLAREEHCKKVKWQVSNWNSKAIAFYVKRGAVIDEVEINCDVTL